MSSYVAAIVLAAGRSERMGSENKLWSDLGGVPVIGRALRAFAAVEAIDTLVIVGPAECHAALSELVPSRPGLELRCVEGGSRRQDSVAAGIAVAEADWYLVHDGARPLASPALIEAVLDAARTAGAAIPGVPVVDTLKRVDGESDAILETVDRASVRAVQTPQGFAGDLLREAHATVTVDATDDASMVEALGRPVVVIEGDPANIKVTRPLDLVIARELLRARDEGQG